MANSPKLDANTLAAISQRTIKHYDTNAAAFREGTWNHDVEENRDAFLRQIVGQPPFSILDLGCGPGRDLVAFRAMGHSPVGLDGSIEFCRMAREASECEVLEQDFLTMTLAEGYFDGIFANASLFHVPTQELARILGQLRLALKPGGVLFSSNPRGDDEQGFSGERFGAYHGHDNWQQIVSSCGFEALETYYRPRGLPRKHQPWLATVFRKI